jgi:hypothetical protein
MRRLFIPVHIFFYSDRCAARSSVFPIRCFHFNGSFAAMRKRKFISSIWNKTQALPVYLNESTASAERSFAGFPAFMGDSPR